MIRSARLLLAVLLLPAPALAQPQIEPEAVTGAWCAGPDGAFYQELELTDEGGVRRYESWLHQRPDESGSWELAGRVLTLRGRGEPRVYEVRTVTRDRLVLRAADGTTEVYLREGCGARSPPQSDQE
jgi:hypothetical protein